MKLTTTLNKIVQYCSFSDSIGNTMWPVFEMNKLFTYLDKTEADDEPLLLETILEPNGLDRALYLLRAVDGHERAMRLYACCRARKVLPIFEMERPRTKRPRKAIETAELFIYGQVTQKDLASACDAAENVLRRIQGIGWAAAQAATASVSRFAYDAAWFACFSARLADMDDPTSEFIRLCRLEGEYGEVTV